MRVSFSKYIAAALIVLGFASTSFAQDKDDIIRPLTKSGSAAFLFNLGGFGTFGVAAPAIGSSFTAGAGNVSLNVSPATVGFKYFLSDDMALRVLLGFSNSSSGADSLPSGAISSTQFGIGAGIEMHMRPLYSTSPYVGAQVGFVSGSETITNKVLGKDQDSKLSGSQFNVAVLAGFDWFFTRGIAIGAEYTLGFVSTSSSFTPAGGTATDAPSQTSIGFGLASGGSVHAVVYF